MDTTLWALIILGVIVIGNFWLCLKVVTNCLLKVDRCEDKLIAMSEAYPHAALIALQRDGMEVTRAAQGQPGQLDGDMPEWTQRPAS